jgi:hypothetical protein
LPTKHAWTLDDTSRVPDADRVIDIDQGSSATHPWIFDSGSAKALAKSMIRLWKSWPACVPDIEHLQSSILKAYPISDSAEALADKIRILSSSD